MASEFHNLLVENLPRMRAYALMLTRNPAHADDLLQDMAFHALRAQNQFEMGTNFVAWLYRIMRNDFVTSLRRAKRAPTPMNDALEQTLCYNAGQEDVIMTNQVHTAMGKLPVSQREVLVLVCASGLSYEEAAEAMNCSVGTVKSRLWRARAHMQKILLGDEAAEAAEAEVVSERPRAAARKQVAGDDRPSAN
jgi:RNA polymerase sigma-70 factor (ECF subfamily)